MKTVSLRQDQGIPGVYGLLLLDVVSRWGYNAETLFSPFQLTSEQLAEPDFRIPVHTANELVKLASRLTGEPGRMEQREMRRADIRTDAAFNAGFDAGAFGEGDVFELRRFEHAGGMDACGTGLDAPAAPDARVGIDRGLGGADVDGELGGRNDGVAGNQLLIAQQVAAKHPARATSLVSIMSTSGDRRLPPATRDAQRALFARPANPHDQNSIIEHSMKIWGVIGSPGFPTDPAELRARTQRSVARSYHPQGVARQLVGILASGDRSSDLKTIRVPTLVIHGDCDPLVRPACGEDTARKIPGARLRIIKGMGHDMAAWPVLADQILAHVRAVGPSAKRAGDGAPFPETPPPGSASPPLRDPGRS